VPCLTLIDDVLRAKQYTLLVTGFAAGVFLLVTAMCMYLAEKGNTVCMVQGGDGTRCQGPITSIHSNADSRRLELTCPYMVITAL
jgi:hypothetical protein